MQFGNNGETNGETAETTISVLVLWHSPSNLQFARNNINEIHLALAWVTTVTRFTLTDTRELGRKVRIH